MKTLAVILQKEFRQFRRNGFLPKLCVMFPLMIMLVMPLVADMEVKNVGVVAVDLDHSSYSRLLLEKTDASPRLRLKAVVQDYKEAIAMIEKGKADVIVEIPYRFQRSLTSPEPLSLHISANSVNGMKGQLGLQYVVSAAGEALQETLQSGNGTNKHKPIDVRSVTFTEHLLYNPTLNYRHFMIPALMIMLIIMLCGFLPALNLVGEKERGTIEQINVTPIRPIVFTFGKIIPYWIIGLFVLSLAMVIAWAVYGLAPAGSVLTIYLAAFLFIIFMSSIGILIAESSENMQQVMFVMFFFVIIFILMSGLLTPIQSMPNEIQPLTYAIPPRYFIDIMRATYLRGATILDQWPYFAALSAFSAGACLLAVCSVRKRQ